MNHQSKPVGEPPSKGKLSDKEKILSSVLWAIAAAMIVLVVVLAVNLKPDLSELTRETPTVVPSPIAESPDSNASRPSVAQVSYQTEKKVVRALNSHTQVMNTNRRDILEYVVGEGDSLFSISKKFDLEPETVFWANYDTLGGSADSIAPGVKLVIPPYDGVYYKWKAGDTFQSIADKFYVDKDEILQSPYNNLDLTDPQVQPDSYIMIPGGKEEIVDWFANLTQISSTGSSYIVSGEYGCANNGGAVGDGFFGNPVAGSTVIGNDFIPGVHDGIDLGSESSNTVTAADDGVVIYAGWSNGGYGNTVLIDHGNGFQSVYAHLSAITVSCGQSVSQGSQIGVVGSTGNSTGPHLHFEIRYNGVADNPHNYI